MELKSISPIEKVGYEKRSLGHWVSHTEIIIDATPEQVWQVLADTENYGQWNDIILQIKGKIKDQSAVDVLFKAGPKAKPQWFHHDVIHVKEGVSFYWSDVQTMGIKDRHSFVVEYAPGGKTKFIHADQVQGGLSWLVGKMAINLQLTVYPMFNRALKAEVEKRFPQPMG